MDARLLGRDVDFDQEWQAIRGKTCQMGEGVLTIWWVLASFIRERYHTTPGLEGCPIFSFWRSVLIGGS
ncbi:MAG: hypothetical protein WBP63_13800, partial [Silvibacterium sp.]